VPVHPWSITRSAILSIGLKIVSRALAAAAVLHDIEAEFLPIDERTKTGAFDSGDVNEDVGPAAVLLNETKAFVRVKEFHGSSGHRDPPFQLIRIWHKPSATTLEVEKEDRQGA
jgi:hypothetical protein